MIRLPSIDDVTYNYEHWQRYHAQLGHLLTAASQTRAEHRRAEFLRRTIPHGVRNEATLERKVRAHQPEQWQCIEESRLTESDHRSCSACRLLYDIADEQLWFRLHGAPNVLCARCYKRMANGGRLDLITEYFVDDYSSASPAPPAATKDARVRLLLPRARHIAATVVAE